MFVAKLLDISYGMMYVLGMVTPATRNRILKRDGYRCQECLRDWSSDPSRLDVDHRLPKSKGGPDTDDNLRTTCLTCNRRKGTRQDWTPQTPRATLFKTRGKKLGIPGLKRKVSGEVVRT